MGSTACRRAPRPSVFQVLDRPRHVGGFVVPKGVAREPAPGHLFLEPVARVKTIADAGAHVIPSIRVAVSRRYSGHVGHRIEGIGWEHARGDAEVSGPGAVLATGGHPRAERNRQEGTTVTPRLNIAIFPEERPRV
jgi:hypothetical protein